MDEDINSDEVEADIFAAIMDPDILLVDPMLERFGNIKSHLLDKHRDTIYKRREQGSSTVSDCNDPTRGFVFFNSAYNNANFPSNFVDVVLDSNAQEIGVQNVDETVYDVLAAGRNNITEFLNRAHGTNTTEDDPSVKNYLGDQGFYVDEINPVPSCLLAQRLSHLLIFSLICNRKVFYFNFNTFTDTTSIDVVLEDNNNGWIITTVPFHKKFTSRAL